MKRNQSGFILLEILILLILVGLFLAAMGPSLVSQMQEAHENQVYQGVHRLIQAELQYAAGVGGGSYPINANFLSACSNTGVPNRNQACLVSPSLTSSNGAVTLFQYTISTVKTSDGFLVFAVPVNKNAGRLTFCGFDSNLPSLGRDHYVRAAVGLINTDGSTAQCHDNMKPWADTDIGSKGDTGAAGGVGPVGPQGVKGDPCLAVGGAGGAGAGGGANTANNGGLAGDFAGGAGSNGGSPTAGYGPTAPAGVDPSCAGQGGGGGGGGQGGWGGWGGNNGTAGTNGAAILNGGLLNLTGPATNSQEATPTLTDDTPAVGYFPQSPVVSRLCAPQNNGPSSPGCGYIIPISTTSYSTLTANVTLNPSLTTIGCRDSNQTVIPCPLTVRLLSLGSTCMGAATTLGSVTLTVSGSAIIPQQTINFAPTAATCLEVQVESTLPNLTNAASVYWTVY